jgi:hypothetical protein
MTGSNQVSNVVSSVVTPVALSGVKTPLLNQFEGAAAAYSLRRLKSWDDGSRVVRVRRDSDNTERDFSSVEVSDGTMARWVNEQPTLPLDLRELDTNTGERDGALIEAAAAYSLRKLKEDFTGDVVEVRRNVDGETEGFTAAEVTDGTLENFVSTGEVVYSSDFSVDANNVIHNVGATKLSVTGNNDGISDGSVTKDNVLKVENIGDVPAAPQLRINTDEYEDSTKGSVTFTYYVPTGHPIVGNYWHIGASKAVDGTETSYSPTGVQIVGGAWTTATVAYENKPSTKRFLTIIDEEVADGTPPAFIPKGDVGDFYYISEIKVYRNEELGLPLDQATGAAAAYSLRNLSSSYTGDVVEVRRSSDDAVQSFTASEVADGTLEDWVNADVVTYESDFSAGVDGWSVQGGTIDGNIDGIGGRDDNLRLTVSSAFQAHQCYTLNEQGTQGIYYNISFDYYIPSSNQDLNGVRLSMYGGPDKDESAPPLDQWNSFSLTSTPTSTGPWFIRGMKDGNMHFTGNGTDVIYVRNIQVTQTTADGHVRTWYDQSGSDNHAVQTTPANQPKIVEGGTYLEEVDFNGTSHYFDLSSPLGTTTEAAVFTVAESGGGTDNFIIDNRDSGGDGFRVFKGGTQLKIDWQATTISNGSPTADEKFVGFAGHDSANLSVGVDGGTTAQANTSTINVATAPRIGARSFTSPSGYWDGTINELIIYNSDQSTKRRAIEENIANHYDISLAAFSRDGTVSTWYDQSGSTPANHATQTDPTKQPAVVLNGDLQKDSLDNPAVKFDNSNDHLANTSFSSQIEGPLTIFTYSDRNGNNGNLFSLTGDADLSGRYFSIHQNADTSEFVARATTPQTISQAGFTGTDARLTTVRTTSDVSYSVGTNGNTFATGTADYGNFPTGSDLRRIVIGKLREGSTTGSQIWGGYIAEIILYSGATHGDQSANRTAIEANIGETYNITDIPAANDTVNGYVQTWYDQSGSGNDAEQVSATKQPKIVNEGTLIDSGILFSGGTQNLETSSTSSFGNNPVSVFSRLKLDSGASGFFLNLGIQRQFINVASGLRRMRAGVNANSGNSTNETEIWSVLFNPVSQGGDPETFAVNGNFYVDGVRTSIEDANVGTQVVGDGRIQIANRTNETDGIEGAISEVIVYDSNQSSNRPAIESNIEYGFKEVNLWLTGGQSNSVGIQSSTSNVTDSSYDSANEINMIAGGWVNTHVYENDGYPTMDYQPQQQWIKYSATNNSGPDRGFARRLAETYDNVRIAKFAVNGKDLDRYFKKSGSGILNPLYQAMIDQFNDAISKLRAGGYKVNLRGFFWSHGYSDSDDSTRASNYETNLNNFISDIRNDLKHIDAESMPFLVAKNAPFWTTVGDTTVETAKSNVAAADSNVELVDTSSLTARDVTVHYDAASYEELGKRAADVFTSNF